MTNSTTRAQSNKNKSASPAKKLASPRRSVKDLLSISPSKATATHKPVFLFGTALVDGYFGDLWTCIPG